MFSLFVTLAVVCLLSPECNAERIESGGFARNGRDLFKGLGVCSLGTQLGKNPKRKRKVQSYGRKCVLENYQSCLLSPRIGFGQLPVRGQQPHD